MALRDLLPFQTEIVRSKKAKAITVDDSRAMVRLFRSAGLAIGFTGGTYVGTRINFEPAPYDFDRIIQAVDSDSYLKQAFNKYKELLWKEGWNIVGENQEAVDYLYQRIDFMELAMRQPFQNFLYDIGDQLLKFSNCFIVKVRNEGLKDFFPYPLGSPADEKPPVIGYQILPSETMEVMRNYHNKPLRYRQNIWGNAGAGAGFAKQDKWSANLLPQWRPGEVIHLKFDCRPGRIYGTPFMVSVMDDVLSLRQIEEDILNLVHKELFPIFKYKVGTEDHPAEPEEIEQAVVELEHMRTEGGLVLPERHDVEVVGVEGKVMDITTYLQHFKERVSVGVGLSPHHLGMLDDANKAIADRLDIALYDKVKTYQRYLSGMIQLMVLNELLLEGGFDPYQAPKPGKTSDKCLFVFNEIDVDTQVKKEQATLQKWQADVLEQPETRIELGLRPEINEDMLYTAQSNRMMPAPGKPVLGGSAPGAASKNTQPQPNAAQTSNGKQPANKANPINPSAGGINNQPNKPDAQKPSAGMMPNLPNRAKATGQQMRPSNQFGRKMSNVRRAEPVDDDFLKELVDLIDDIESDDDEFTIS